MTPPSRASRREMGLSPLRRARSRTADAEPEGVTARADPSQTDAHSVRNAKRTRKRRPHAPGVWIVYFSLAALPLFGLGQLLLPSGDMERRRWAFQLLCVYVASGLGLLLTTSFLGLRRYLRRRGVEMQDDMARVWIALGAAIIVVLLFVAALLPRPAAEIALSRFPIKFTTPQRESSRYAFGGEAADAERPRFAVLRGRRRRGGFEATSKPTLPETGRRRERGVSLNRASPNRVSPNRASPSRGSRGRPTPTGATRQKANRRTRASRRTIARASPIRHPPTRASPIRSGQGESDQNEQNEREERRHKRIEGREPEPEERQPPKRKRANLPIVRNKGNRPRRTRGRESRRRNRTSRRTIRRVPPDRRDVRHRPTPPRQPGGSGFPLPRLDLALGGLLKLLLYAVILGLVGYWLWKSRAQVLAAIQQFLRELSEFWARLFGGRRHDDAVVDEKGAETPPPRPFSDYADPFASGAAARHPPDAIVRYTFEAVEAWAREQGCPRHPDQTPQEFARQIGNHADALSAGAATLADLYCRIAYASARLSPQSIRPLEPFWQTLRRE